MDSDEVNVVMSGTDESSTNESDSEWIEISKSPLSNESTDASGSKMSDNKMPNSDIRDTDAYSSLDNDHNERMVHKRLVKLIMVDNPFEDYWCVMHENEMIESAGDTLIDAYKILKKEGSAKSTYKPSCAEELASDIVWIYETRFKDIMNGIEWNECTGSEIQLFQPKTVALEEDSHFSEVYALPQDSKSFNQCLVRTQVRPLQKEANRLWSKKRRYNVLRGTIAYFEEHLGGEVPPPWDPRQEFKTYPMGEYSQCGY